VCKVFLSLHCRPWLTFSTWWRLLQWHRWHRVSLPALRSQPCRSTDVFKTSKGSAESAGCAWKFYNFSLKAHKLFIYSLLYLMQSVAGLCRCKHINYWNLYQKIATTFPIIIIFYEIIEPCSAVTTTLAPFHSSRFLLSKVHFANSPPDIDLEIPHFFWLLKRMMLWSPYWGRRYQHRKQWGRACRDRATSTLLF